MVIDTSAVLIILPDERDAARYAEAIEKAESRHMSSANYSEAALIVDTRGDPIASREFDLFFRRAGILIEPVSFEQAQIARQACLDFGQGRHPAALNFRDCLAYALAKSLDEPLLFKGSEFSRTDIQAAV
jgi:ribonuclease VapC